ncbi:MAG TPA: hypothetical protein VKQ36_11015, partial [Ktedonobacterales bacterium]|nr:hypothetical protein [Ktedonobacterales bacterium]
MEHSEYAHENKTTLTDAEEARGELLLARVVDFTRLLWELGLDVGPGRVVELAQSLPLVNVASRDEFYLFLKVNLVSKHEQEPIFDQAFAYFWRIPGAGGDQPPASEDARRRQALALPAHRQRPEDRQQARHALAPG